jgi:hypothetical protein
MNLDEELKKTELNNEAYLEFWNKYHEKIEKLGYSLNKTSSFLHSFEKGWQIVAKIRSNDKIKSVAEFRNIFGEKFFYTNNKISVEYDIYIFLEKD